MRSSLADLLRPEAAVPLGYAAFLLLAAIAYGIEGVARHLTLPYPSALALGISLLAILVLIPSVRIGRRLELLPWAPLIPPVVAVLTALALYLTFPMPWIAISFIATGYATLLWAISRRLGDVKLITPVALLLACAFSVAILLQGIPILDAASRTNAAVTPTRALFHGFGVFGAALLAAFYPRRWAIPGILILALLGFLSGFKSDSLSILSSGVITGLLLGRVKVREVLLAGVIALLILTLGSTHIASMAYGGWKLSPALYIPYRFGFTYSVFGQIVDLSFPLGLLHGGALLSTTQEVVSTAVLAYKEPHIITSTLIGPGMLDFGLPGVLATAALIGLYLGAMDRRGTNLQACLYAIALTHTLVLLEVGLQLSSVLLYLSLLYLSLGAGGVADV